MTATDSRQPAAAPYPAGQVFGLLGPDGAGKTTAIRAITTLLKVPPGMIHVFRHFAGSELLGDQDGGSFRDVRRSRVTASRVG